MRNERRFLSLVRREAAQQALEWNSLSFNFIAFKLITMEVHQELLYHSVKDAESSAEFWVAASLERSSADPAALDLACVDITVTNGSDAWAGQGNETCHPPPLRPPPPRC